MRKTDETSAVQSLLMLSDSGSSMAKSAHEICIAEALLTLTDMSLQSDTGPLLPESLTCEPVSCTTQVMC